MTVWKIILKKSQVVRRLLNIITAEFMKIKNNKMIYICSFIAVIVPVLIVIKDLFYLTSVQRVGIDAWIISIVSIVLLSVYPVLSGFIITYLIQKEYGDQTIINTLTAPTSRTSFLLSKVIVWALWHISATIICLLITYVGCYILFPAHFSVDTVIKIAVMFFKCSILNFVSLLPVFWVTIKQKKLFYPSLLICLLFVIIGLGSMNMPIALASILPWSAVMVLCSYETINIYYLIGVFSLSICGLASFILSIRLFKHQNL